MWHEKITHLGLVAREYVVRMHVLPLPVYLLAIGVKYSVRCVHTVVSITITLNIMYARNIQVRSIVDARCLSRRYWCYVDSKCNVKKSTTAR